MKKRLAVKESRRIVQVPERQLREISGGAESTGAGGTITYSPGHKTVDEIT